MANINSKSDQEILKDARDHMELVSVMETAIREEGKRCLQFRALDQWEQTMREMRGTRPTLTVDQTGQYVDQVVGDWRRNRLGITIKPCDAPADPETARILDGWIRQIQYQSKSHISFDWAFECMAAQNRGFVKLGTKRRQGSFKQDVRILKIANPDCVYMDPFCREPDYSDQRKTLIRDNVGHEAFKSEYGRLVAEDGSPVITDFAPYLDSPDYKGWVDKHSVGIGEWWVVDEIPRKIQLLNKPIVVIRNNRALKTATVYDDEWDPQNPLYAGIEVVLGPDGKPMEDDEPVREVCQYILTGFQIIEKNKWPGQYIPVIPMLGKEVYYENKKRLYSLISRGLDSQRLMNYAISSLAERLQQFPKAPMVGATGSFKTDATQWAKMNTTPFAYLQVDPVDLGNGQGKVYIPPEKLDMDPRLDQMGMTVQICKDLLKGTIGMYGSSLGQEDPKAKSGVAIEALQREGDNATFDFMDNGGRAIELAGKMIVDIAPHILSGPEIIQIRDEQNRTLSIAVNQEIEMMDKVPEGQRQSFWINQVSNAQYSVEVTAAPSHDTLREQGQRMMLEMLPNMDPEERKQAIPVILRMSDAFGAKELADKLDPPQGKEDPELIKRKLQQAMQVVEIQAGTIEDLENEKLAKSQDIASKERIAALNASIERLKIIVGAVTAEEKMTSDENREDLKLQAQREMAELNAQIAQLSQSQAEQHEITMAQQQAEQQPAAE